MLTYKNYTADIEVDVQAKILHGRVRDIQGVVTFEGKTVEEIEHEFQKSIDIYLTFCQEVGQEPEKPVPSHLDLPTTPAILKAASQAGKSVDGWAREILTDAANRTTTRD